MDRRTHPGTWTLALSLFYGREAGREIAADLAEEARQIAGRHGFRAARRWHRRQLRRSVLFRTADMFLRLLSAVLTFPRASARGVTQLLRPAGGYRPVIRSLRKAPWYSATVIAVVALALSFATTVFAIVDGVLFKPLPYADAHQLVALEPRLSARPDFRGGRIQTADVEDWQAAMPDVPLGALRVVETTGLELLNEVGLGLALVRPQLLDVLGVRPFIGGFTQDDLDALVAETPSVRPVLVTFDFWQDRLGGTPDIVGRVVEPTDPTALPVRIAGVLPPGFVVPADRPAQLVMPAPDRYADSLRRTVLLARLPDGMTPAALASRLEAAMRGTIERADGHPRTSGLPDTVVVVPLAARDGWTQGAFSAVFAAMTMLVLVACLNLSGLMTARWLDRAREMGVRRAIGARGVDAVGHVFAEHALLFVVGGILGIAIAVPLLRGVTAVLPPDLQLLKTPTVDLRTAAFAFGAMLLSLTATSLWPMRCALRPEGPALGPRGSVTATRSAAAPGLKLVTTGQVAGTLVLVLAGSLVMGSLWRVKANGTGYEPDGVVVAELALAPWLDGAPGWNRRPDVILSVDAFLSDVRRLRDVQAAGAADVSFLQGSLGYRSRFDPEGEAPDPDGPFQVGLRTGLNLPVTAGFFRAAGLVPLEGRLPTDAELIAGEPVVVVSRTYALDRFAGRSAVGQRLTHTPRQDHPPFEIVGVVDDPRLSQWDTPSSPTVFTAYATFGGNPDPVVFVRAPGSTSTVVGEVARRANALRPFLRPVRVDTAEAMLGESILVRRLRSWLFGSFAVAGVVLAAVGVLGLVAMTMARRTREIGIRMALGASRDRLVSGLVGEQLRAVLLGLASGGIIAAWAVRFLESYVYELSVYDPRVWAAAVVIVSVTAMVGALVPSIRASRVDPVNALRAE